MKKLLCSATLALILSISVPQYTHAFVVTDEYRAEALKLIALLQSQIEFLQHILAEIQIEEKKEEVLGQGTITVLKPAEKKEEKHFKTVSMYGLKESQFYSGSYIALYLTDGYGFVSKNGTKIEDDFEEIWETFVEIAGVELILREFTEFRVYMDEDAEFDAFVERIGEESSWVLGVNFNDLDLTRKNVRDDLDELLLHEYGHVIFDNSEIFSDFEERFWDEDDAQNAEEVSEAGSATRRDRLIEEYYEENVGDFVSVYAVSSPLEDIIESFVYFVLEEKQYGNNEMGKKINFFYGFRSYVETRNRIRSRL